MRRDFWTHYNNPANQSQQRKKPTYLTEECCGLLAKKLVIDREVGCIACRGIKGTPKHYTHQFREGFNSGGFGSSKNQRNHFGQKIIKPYGGKITHPI